ncbi:hypothetical protein BJ875DRAFT_441185 [Amylocarpus encephaloides]|uniref:NADPH-dependent diflavin oxidoreductase 1 n=1 Tax=Amylocarpus encephaloides TaxID=45428 RepID=A0A9P7YJ40_9HELO|nr:hypothetical protein BJ875DRAFT_441185 [Amylocarpus encephaloides]
MVPAIQGQSHDRSLLIVYATETGNSHDVAEELGRMTERMHFLTRVCEMDRVEINLLLKHTAVIFVISTAGQGEFPRKARKFWKSLLRKRLPPGCLGHVRFTTFGLGDSSYAQFNWAARKLHKRLEQLGAQEIYPRGEADEQHDEGIDGTFLSWSLDFGKRLLCLYPLAEGVTPIPPEVLLPPKHFLALVDDASQNISSPNRARNISVPSDSADPSTPELKPQPKPKPTPIPSTLELKPDASMDYTSLIQLEPRQCPQLKEAIDGVPDPVDHEIVPSEDRLLPIPDAFEARLVENQRLTPIDHWQDVRQLTFHMNADLAYFPGDTITLYPKNFPEDVDALIGLMGWEEVANKRVKFEASAPKWFAADNIIPMVAGLYTHPRTTLRELLSHNLDITAIPKRYFFELISHYTDDPTHQERLLEFSNPAYTDEFFDYTTRPRRSILEILQDFPTVKIPWKFATSLFPVIRGRQYSISSGGALQRNRRESGVTIVQLLVAIVKYQTVLKKIRQGLCSRYVASLPEGTLLHVGLETGTMNQEKYLPNYPVILIGPGTGLAPLRSLIHQRAKCPTNENQIRQPAMLFYGGRNKEADFLYADEWKDKTLGVTVHTAFSRDQREKIYVQDIIRKEGRAVWEMLRKNAVIYVCGSSGNMPKAVREAIIDIMEEFGTFGDRKAAEDAFADLQKRGHHVQETW